MKTASGLAMIALGAILAFAVTGHPSFLNIQVAGWVIMLTGLAGMFIPARGYGWLRRRIVQRQAPDGRIVRRRVTQRRLPSYVRLNPGATMADPGPTVASQASPGPGSEPVTSVPIQPGETLLPAEEVIEEFLPAGDATASPLSGEAVELDPTVQADEGLRPVEETVEEFLPE